MPQPFLYRTDASDDEQTRQAIRRSASSRLTFLQIRRGTQHSLRIVQAPVHDKLGRDQIHPSVGLQQSPEMACQLLRMPYLLPPRFAFAATSNQSKPR